MVTQLGVEPKVYGPQSRIHPATAMGSRTPHISQTLPSTSPPSNLFVQTLGRPDREHIPPQNAALTSRALEEWERTLCENKAVAILDKLQEGRPVLFQQDGGAIYSDRPGPTTYRGARPSRPTTTIPARDHTSLVFFPSYASVALGARTIT